MCPQYASQTLSVAPGGNFKVWGPGSRLLYGPVANATDPATAVRTPRDNLGLSAEDVVDQILEDESVRRADTSAHEADQQREAAEARSPLQTPDKVLHGARCWLDEWSSKVGPLGRWVGRPKMISGDEAFLCGRVSDESQLGDMLLSRCAAIVQLTKGSLSAMDPRVDRARDESTTDRPYYAQQCT